MGKTQTEKHCQGCPGNCQKQEQQQVIINQAKLKTIIERIANAQRTGVNVFDAIAYSSYLFTALI